MFILRKVFNGEGEANTVIGDGYNLVDREAHKEQFEKTAKLWNGGDGWDGSIYAFIVHERGANIIPLYEGHNNYMMTSTGDTFANLTCKHKQY